MLTFNHNNLNVGDTYSLDSFLIKEESHQKTVQLLKKSEKDHKTKFQEEYLLPSETWGIARVLSQYFGKLNEVILARSTWTKKADIKPETELSCQTIITKKSRKMPLITARSRTFSDDDEVFESEDTFILLNGQSFKPNLKQEEFMGGIYLGTRQVYFRYEWHETKWRDNIHTENYATTLGYKEELPEFTTYMDWMFTTTNCTKVQIKRIMPMYKQEDVLLYQQNNDLFFVQDNSTVLRAVIE